MGLYDIYKAQLLSGSGGDSGSSTQNIEWNDNVSGAFTLSHYNDETTANTTTILNTMVKSVVIPYGFTEIGNQAFANMDIENVVIPESVTSIGLQAFAGTAVENVVIPEGVTSIGGNCFISCKSLKSITIPKSLESIGSSAFSECNSLTNAKISCETVPMDSFGGTTVENVILEDGVVAIEDRVFQGCTKLSQINFPNSLQTISNNAFNGCKSLKSAELSCKTIGSNAFYDCAIEHLVLNEGVEEIKSGAFVGALISKLVIPSTVKNIENGGFANCLNLKEIEIMTKDAFIGSAPGAFIGCTNLEKIIVHAPENSIAGAPWGATNAEVIWTG